MGMRTRKRSRKSKSDPSKASGKESSNGPFEPVDPSFGFLAAFDALLGQPWRPVVPKRRGRKPRVALHNVLAALIFHCMNAAGSLGEHFAMLFDDALNDSSCSDRRTRLPWEVFAELMRRVLRPLAHPRRHKEAYWR